MFPLVKYRAIRVGEHGFITGILDPSAYASNRHAQESSGVEIEWRATPNLWRSL